ncbi:TetR/AcrR family transcriptional regulator [Thermodesulfobacterium hydrogeniphilum]|uniref:TetR/AcrR family transcriptional regulator n=1 Tax=Thermodesulfobacterium hydrogeniphilum TaxID=161156 RepID=UPI00068E9964|nr:TetR/AcrR family transcriptional regulator [Thermodesulfobacterium hydrogeniphilum]
MAKNTKKKIIEAALKLFSKKGYLGATTKEIAREAKVAEVTLFRYFPSKEALFEEVINTYSFFPKLKAILSEIQDKNYIEALKIIAQNFLNLLESKKDLIKIMHSEMQRYPDQIKKIYENVIDSTVNLLSDYFKSLQKEGILRDFNTEIVARAFLGMFFSYFYVREIKECVSVQKSNIEEIIDVYVSIFANGTFRI